MCMCVGGGAGDLMRGHFSSSQWKQVSKCVFTKTKANCISVREISSKWFLGWPWLASVEIGPLCDESSLMSHPVLEAPSIHVQCLYWANSCFLAAKCNQWLHVWSSLTVYLVITGQTCVTVMVRTWKADGTEKGRLGSWRHRWATESHLTRSLLVDVVLSDPFKLSQYCPLFSKSGQVWCRFLAAEIVLIQIWFCPLLPPLSTLSSYTMLRLSWFNRKVNNRRRSVVH